MIGTVLSHYRIVEKIGEGGMGEVYRAEDQRLPRSVAIKILPDRALGSPERRERFIREARAASTLSHPGIVHVYDVDESQGHLFIAMEFVAGRTVSALIEAGPIALDEILRIGVEVAEALAAAHAHGIVHRDVKPSNILVAHEGFVKVFDFGLAKLLGPLEASAPDDASTRAPNLTRYGQLIGTVLYMSPELALGETVDHRSDIFSFGAVLYEMATARLPFSGTSEVAIIDQILHGAAPPMAEIREDLPGEFVSIVSKAMEKRTENRYQSMEEILVDLRNLRRDVEAGVSPKPRRTQAGFASFKPRPRMSRLRGALWGSVALAAAVAAALVIDRGATGTPRAAERRERSVAVLPFENASADAESRYFSDGVTEGIIVDLSRIANLKVVMPPGGPEPTAATDTLGLARKLSVETLLEGTVRRDAATVRVSARLRSVPEGRVLWADKYTRGMSDVFGLQDEVSHQIAQALEIELTRTEAERIARVPTTNLEAYDAYLRGRELLRQRRPQETRGAIAQFEHARTLDPNYAEAFSGLADAYAVGLMYGWDVGDGARDRADEASRQAITLDPTLAEAHLSRGVVAALEGDMEGGTSRVLHALSLDPGSARAHHWLSVLYKLQGNYDAARVEDLAALRLDPTLVPARLNLAHVAILNGHPEEAVAGMRDLLEVADLPLARALLAWGMLRTGHAREALQHLDTAAAMSPDDPLLAGMRAMALAQIGSRGAALTEASRASQLSAARPFPLADYAVACVHALVGSDDDAFRFLERALKSPALSLNAVITPAYIRDDPALARVRSDPRFARLVGGR
ncbi:MAG: protein kinase [Acidobacteria bacterium]|nr:protein kinase [Acidobacteriota bacterium]